jgi:hypothetical protein
VGDRAILRMGYAPSDLQLSLLNDAFGHVVTQGRIEVIEPTNEERATNDELELARIAFSFDRRSYGELRRIIDVVNSWVNE